MLVVMVICRVLMVLILVLMTVFVSVRLRLMVCVMRTCRRLGGRDVPVVVMDVWWRGLRLCVRRLIIRRMDSLLLFIIWTWIGRCFC